MSNARLIEDGAIAVKDGKIAFVGKSASARGIRSETKLNAKGKVAIPGLINCHTHAPMTLFRGIAEDQPLDKWLKEAIWPLEAKLKPEDVYTGALLACVEMIKNGVTCFADMYFHENMVAEAVKNSGLRGVLAEGIIEAANSAVGEKMFHSSVEFAKKYDGYADDRVKAMLGPHAAYTCSEKLLKRVIEEASKLGIGVHLHIAELSRMFREFEAKYGLSEVEFLDGISLFKNNVLAAHCVNLSKEDMQILSGRGVNVAHVPVANMKLGLGAARIKELKDLGANICLGTDGPASNNSLDMFETMKTAALLQKLTYQDPTVFSAYEVLRMATVNGAKALRLYDSIGSIEVGKKADIILIDFSKPHLKPLHNTYANLVYCARGSDVDTVIVDGKILMENRQLRTVDEQTVMEKAEKTASDLLLR